MESNAKPTPDLPSSPSDAFHSPFDIVALIGSAGGLDAISTILQDLPANFPAAVLVAQHLGASSSSMVMILAHQTRLPVAWIEDGTPINPGQVLVCPHRRFVEVFPDGTCSLRPSEHGTWYRPFDVLLRSLGESFGPRTLAVILTGMTSDGAAGARAVKRAGGTVIVQSEETARAPSMPHAAIETGAADLVLPLSEIGPVIVDAIFGRRLALPRKRPRADALLAGPGEARAELRAFAWSANSLGPSHRWPPSLRMTVSTMLAATFPMCIFWGPEYVQIYNDAWRPILEGKPPAAGQPARTTWADMWSDVGSRLDTVARTGQAVYAQFEHSEADRDRPVRDAYFDLSYSPLLNDDGTVGGVLCTAVDMTARVHAERRIRTLGELASTAIGVETVNQSCARAAKALGKNPRDLPFALLYLKDRATARANLGAAVGLAADAPATWRTVDLKDGCSVLPLASVIQDGEPMTLDHLSIHLGLQSWREADLSALLLPLRSAPDQPPLGVFVAGIRPPLDLSRRSFLELVAAQLGTNLAEALARQDERERMDQLAELDRVKTEFFSNISHEFRTPLTLLLAPLEELSHRSSELPAALTPEIEAASHNAKRLLNLVENLLDFSQAEAARLHAHFEPTDLAALTAGIAGLFQSAADRAGLALRIECPPLAEPVWVDRAMWEKIVSNLLSNAIKFTFQGEIVVELRTRQLYVELVVRDTGVGIPAEDLPHIFERFYRSRRTQARTQEGAGIGLALVRELARLQFGRVRVQSQEGQGAAFTVWIPIKSPAMGCLSDSDREPPGDAPFAVTVADEAARWDNPDNAGTPPIEVVDEPLRPTLQPHGAGAHVLVADDNADMRHYLERLLSQHWRVETANDGIHALEQARCSHPDLILADVMMPNFNGFELLRQVRADETLRTTPVILLTARAGEEEAIQGILSGADDYIAKPFSARELVARVGAQLELARLRQRVEQVNAFRVQMTDTLHALTNTVEIQYAASRILGEYLEADRVFCIDVQAGGEQMTLQPGYHREGVPEYMGDYPLSQFGSALMSGLFADRTLVINDVETQPGLTDEQRATCSSRALIAVPVLTQDRLTMILGVHQLTPRAWTAEEAALIEEVAERTWVAVERARAEEALRRSEERFRALVTASSDALYRMSADWSEMLNLKGMDFIADTEVPRRNWLNVYIPRDEQARVRESVCGAVRTRSVFELEHRVIRLDGAEGWVFSRAVPVLNSAGEITEWFGEATDVTERKRLEEALRESEERFRVSQENSPDRFTLLRPAFNEQGEIVDFIYLYENPTGARLSGRTPAEMVGRRIGDLYPSFPRTRFFEEYRRVALARRPVEFEDHYEGDGVQEWFRVVVTPTADGIAVSTHSITERKQAEGELQALNERLNQVLESISDVFYAVDASWRLTYLNHHAEQAWHRSRQELLGTILWDMFPNYWETQGYREHVLAMQERTPRHAEFYSPNLKIWVEVNIYPAVNGGLSVYFRDITERKRAEEALRESEEKYHSLFNAIREGFALYEVIYRDDGQPYDFRFLDVNPAYLQGVGLSRDRIIGKSMREINPNIEQHWLDFFCKVATTEEPDHLVDYSGYTGRWIDIYAFTAKKGQIAFILSDITERKQAEMERERLLAEN